MREIYEIYILKFSSALILSMVFATSALARLEAPTGQDLQGETAKQVDEVFNQLQISLSQYAQALSDGNTHTTAPAFRDKIRQSLIWLQGHHVKLSAEAKVNPRAVDPEFEARLADFIRMNPVEPGSSPGKGKQANLLRSCVAACCFIAAMLASPLDPASANVEEMPEPAQPSACTLNPKTAQATKKDLPQDDGPRQQQVPAK